MMKTVPSRHRNLRYAFKSQDLKPISQDKKQIQGHQRTEKQFLRIQIQGQ